MLSVVVKSALELAVVILLIYGFIHEKEVIRFELWLKIVALRAAIIVLNAKEKQKNV